MLLSSQFQGFCRDLHSEAIDFLVSGLTPVALGTVLRGSLIQGRKLDSGNPNPGNLGSDFQRLAMSFWPQLDALDARNKPRRSKLEELNTWRNAIAHQDWSKVGPKLQLRAVRRWRSVCNGLARDFDAAVGAHLAALVGTAPW